MTALVEKDLNDVLTISNQVNECTSMGELQSVSLELLEQSFKTDACIIALSHGVYGRAGLDRFQARGLSDNYHALYLSRYHRLDPFAKWLRQHQGAVPTVTTGERLVNYRNFIRSKIYEEYYGHFSIHHILAIHLACEGRPFGFMGLYRSRHEQRYSEREMAKAAMISPYVATALQKVLNSERVDDQAGIIDALSAELTSKGVLVLNQSRIPVYLDAAARNIFSELLERTDQGDHLSQWCPDELHHCCDEVAATDASGEGEIKTATCEIEVPRAGQRISCQVQLLNRAGKPPLFLVYLEPQTSFLFASERIRRAGLSSREMDIVFALSEGLTNQEIADTLHISVYTVQTHLQSIYSKLGVRNRTGLIHYFNME